MHIPPGPPKEAGAAAVHAVGGARHSASTLAELNTKISDATLYEWENDQGATNIHAGNIAEGAVTQHEAAIDHDALLNFVAAEHVDHSGVTLTAGSGLSGGGTIEADRTFDLDIGLVGASISGLAAADLVAVHEDASGYTRKITVANFEGALNHDNLAGFVANEHVNWAATGAEDLHDDRVAESNVTQHQAALAIACTQLTGNMPDARIQPSNVTQHQGVIDHNALTNYGIEEHRDIQIDVIASQPPAGTANRFFFATDELIPYYDDGGSWSKVVATPDAHGLGGPEHGTATLAGLNSKISDATLYEWEEDQGATNIHAGNIAEGAVTQHEAAIDHDALTNFVAQEHIRWDQTGAEDLHDDRVAESNVTQHEAALAIAASQITGALGETHGGTGIATYASGDIIYADGADSLAALAKGSNDQVLTLAAGLPSWQDLPAAGSHDILSATHDDTVTDSIIRGDILVGNATPKLDRLAIGPAFLVLTSNGSDPLWAHINANHIEPAAGIYMAQLEALTINRALQTSGAGVIEVSDVTSTELGYLDGVTSAIQDQLDAKQDLDADLTALAGISGVNGDIIIRSGGTWARLAKGTDGQFLSLDSGLPAWKTLTYRRFELIIDGGGSAITTGIKGDMEVCGGTIVGVRLLADQTGSIVIDLWKDTYANFPPTVADTITASAKPTISSGVKDSDETLTGWTTSLTDEDIIRVNVDSCSTITRCTLVLIVQVP